MGFYSHFIAALGNYLALEDWWEFFDVCRSHFHFAKLHIHLRHFAQDVID